MKQIFDCVDAVNMDEYVGCKVEREEGVFKFTQPVITYILKKIRLAKYEPGYPWRIWHNLDESRSKTFVGEKETNYLIKDALNLLHIMRC